MSGKGYTYVSLSISVRVTGDGLFGMAPMSLCQGHMKSEREGKGLDDHEGNTGKEEGKEAVATTQIFIFPRIDTAKHKHNYVRALDQYPGPSFLKKAAIKISYTNTACSALCPIPGRCSRSESIS